MPFNEEEEEEEVEKVEEVEEVEHQPTDEQEQESEEIPIDFGWDNSGTCVEGFNGECMLSDIKHVGEYRAAV